MARVTDQAAQAPVQVVRVSDAGWESSGDMVAVEEPMEIRLLQESDGGTTSKPIAITMRTPGDDFELAVGFLLGEGIIGGRDDIFDVSYCLDDDIREEQYLNVVSVTVRPELPIDLARVERNFYTTSSCGVCGKASLEALEMQSCMPLPPGPPTSADVIRRLPGLLRDAQPVFRVTGGLHAAGLFDTGGRLVDLREDVGRHNALDKLIGRQVMTGSAGLEDRVLLLSGRASFELLQKALMARIPVVAAVGAPSSLAIALAETFNITLCGFVRDDGFNIYAGAERLTGL
ncbi:MAG TPA: formate dehydrogenase accessory sulfurtransferase FdhD [Thermomicrobiales bacterium]|nr:formate dehydrogenase accessory sulfurtransferase FdhD [Thermomicrobiales bacterium]